MHGGRYSLSGGYPKSEWTSRYAMFIQAFATVIQSNLIQYSGKEKEMLPDII